MAIPPILPTDLTVLDACAGFGMLGEAVLLGLDALGLGGRVVVHVERDSAAAAALVARMEGSPVDQAPVCDTLRAFDTRPWRGLVDVACAGLPCQPYSPAGKRRGNDDHRSWGNRNGRTPRGPVAQFLRIVRDLLPAVVFLENVPAWVVGGHFRSVGQELCRLGYTLEDPIFLAASDVGAPHERERVFIMAHSRHCDWRRWLGEQLRERAGGFASADRSVADGDIRARQRADAGEPDGRPNGRHDAFRRGERLCRGDGQAVPDCARQQGWRRNGESRPEIDAIKRHARLGGCELGDARHASVRSVPREDEAGARAATGRGAVPYFPPGRGDESDPDHPDWRAWAAVAALDPSFMPRVEPELSVVADGLAFSRSDLLRIGGNGVVPVAGAIAFAVSLARVLDRLDVES